LTSRNAFPSLVGTKLQANPPSGSGSKTSSCFVPSSYLRKTNDYQF
jgi:hypothetical protein